MKTPPIRYVCEEFAGHIVEIDDDTNEVTVRLDSGELRKLPGNRPVSAFLNHLDA